MVVISKSKSHPDLLFYASESWIGEERGRLVVDDCDDSVSSLVDVLSVEKPRVKATPTEDRSVIGRLLWKLLLNKELPVKTEDVEWDLLKKQHVDVLASVSVEDLRRYHASLTSIVILDESIDERASDVLKEYNGRLVDISPVITNELSHQSPDQFTAFVADWNDNLAYSMQSARGIPGSSNVQDWQRELAQLEESLQSKLKSSTPLEIQGSFLKTEYKTIPQPAHVDYPWQTLRECGKELWLAFFGLTQDGMLLQLWPHVNKCRGLLVYVPLQKLLILPSNTIHGGGFRTSLASGNLRYHLYLATDGASLPRFAQNYYTLPHDKRHELAEVCLNAPGLHSNGYENSDEEEEALLMDLLLE